MRKLVLPFAVALTLALPAGAAWALPSHLQYSFDGTSAGAPGPTLTLHGGATTTANGVGHGAETPGDRALTLDGDDDYAEAQDATFQPGSGGDFSVSLWAKSTGWGFSWQPLAFMDDDDYDTYSWAVYGTTNDSGTVHAYVRIRDGATLDTLDLHGSGTTLSDGTWHNLALSVDGNEATLYFDGDEIDDETSTLTGGTVNPDADHFFAGGDLYYSSEKFDGLIDTLRYYDSAISAEDAATLDNPFF
jgi:Concanavalin A-like lectin/glucanases superfamily